MVVPDWIIALLVKLGLKQTPEQKIAKEIANLEEMKRQLNQDLDLQIDKIRDLEADLKLQKTKYEAAHGAEKNMLAAKIKPLIQQLNQMKEKEVQLSQKLKDLTLLIHNKGLILQEAKAPDLVDKLEDARDEKRDLLDEAKAEEKAAEKLSNLTLESKQEEPLSFDTLSSTEMDDDLLKEMNQYLSDSKEEKKTESVEA
ncbi:MAG: hypothetical protein IJW05_09835 [Lentisphaeria bacterium]|nr:hypothetical protein [Lentisphaeria bacterium]